MGSSNSHESRKSRVDEKRRRSIRIDSDVETSYGLLNGELLQARLRNISRGGALLESRISPATGDIVTLDTGTEEPLVGSVVHVESDDNKSYRFGISFYERRDRTAESGVSSQFLKSRAINVRAFSYYKRLKRVKSFVVRHIADDVPLQRAARVAAMERTYFSSFFHKKVGVSYREWLQYLRVREAMRRLETENCTITEVAFESGFSDLRTFERNFKKWTSITPREFKKIVMP